LLATQCAVLSSFTNVTVVPEETVVVDGLNPLDVMWTVAVVPPLGGVGGGLGSAARVAWWCSVERNRSRLTEWTIVRWKKTPLSNKIPPYQKID